MAVWNGSNFLVAWTQLEYVANDDGLIHHDLQPMRIRGAMVSRELAAETTRTLADVEGDNDFEPSLASNGSEWLLVWTSFHEETLRQTVRARRFRDDGTGHGSAAGRRVADGSLGRVAFDGERYVAVWREGETPKLAFLTIDGIAHPANSILAAEPVHEIVFSALGPGRVVLVYTRTSWAAEHGGVPRAFLKLAELRTKTRPVR